MARARNIKPGFFTDAELVECDVWVRLLFAGLWTIADREGRLLDRPKQIGVDLFPRDRFDIDAGLSDLADHGLIVRYEVEGQRLIQITNFTKHQNPHRDERASTLPPAPSMEEHSASTVDAPCEPGANRADSGFPVTDSLIPDSPTPDDAPAARESVPFDPEFEGQFWKRWPKGRGSKAKAHAEWRRMSRAERAAALAALPAFLACEQWRREGGRFVKHAERWLRDKGWLDDVPPDTARATPNGRAPDPAMAAWLEVVRVKEHQRIHNRSPDAPVPAPIFDAVTAIGGWAHVDPANDFHRRDFLQAYRAITSQGSKEHWEQTHEAGGGDSGRAGGATVARGAEPQRRGSDDATGLVQ